VSCCPQDSYDGQFDVRQAKHDLKRLHREGPDPTTRALIDALKRAGASGTLLDVGGGVGAIHHELLDEGIASAYHVDVSRAYLNIAKEEAERRGHAQRVRFVRGDFVAVAGDLPDADVVTLDRVICCYPDMPALVHESASRARKIYGVVFPRTQWFLRPAFAAINLWKTITGSKFRVFLHDEVAIENAIRDVGLAPSTTLRTFVWNVRVYTRVKSLQ
jgi:2-polyprenyl-3-methyl-5-hydroxy-6-metoxy-1,4-benzoquinol methylase